MKFCNAALSALVGSSSLSGVFASGLRAQRHTDRNLAHHLPHVDASPLLSKPLGLCQGDCDTNDDCDTGLVCFQRGSKDEVPGCRGGSADESPSDYCVLDTTSQPSMAPTAAPSQSMSPSSQPTSQPTSLDFEMIGTSDGYDPDMPYSEAVALCASKGYDRLCFASEYEAQGDCELDGCEGDSWAPINDVEDGYTQIGCDQDKNPCVQVCCAVSKTDDIGGRVGDSESPSSAPSSAPSPSPSTSPSVSVKPSSSPSSHPTHDNFELLGSSDGYASTMTYNDAVDFCIGKGYDRLCSANEYTTYVVDCSESECGTDSWAPISDLQNEYLQIGGNCHAGYGTSGNCYKHSDLIGLGVPSWATDDASWPFRLSVCCAKTPSEAPSSSPSVSASPSTTPSATPSAAPTEPTPSVLVNLGPNPPGPLGACTGDCDFNSDCAEGLICFQRDENQPVPGCAGGEMDGSKTDFCVYESASFAPSASPSSSPSTSPSEAPSVSSAPSPMPSRPFLQLKTYAAGEEPSTLGPCEGDCDYNSDCAEGMICFQRDGGEDVPGCLGADSSKTDFCVYESAFTPTASPSGKPTEKPSLFFASASPSFKPSLSIAPSVSQEPSSSTAPSKAIPTLLNLGPNPPGPLGVCTGDCDFNSDCAEGLICFQRDENQPVPGCSGGENDSSKTDFCVYESASLHPTASPSSSPSLKPSQTPSVSSAPSPLSSMPTRPLGELKAYPAGEEPSTLGLCEGDCDYDSDCESGLFCNQREASNPGAPVAGCIGGSLDTSRTDFCTYLEFKQP